MSGGKLRVALVTTWDTACGIAEHSRMLKQAVEAADPEIEIIPDPAGLNPRAGTPVQEYELLHLNYQAALHSGWTDAVIREYRRVRERPVLVTYHDTGVPNSDQCKSVVAAADAAVVHEPFDDLPVEKTRYWRMGVEEDDELKVHPLLTAPPWHALRPTLGTVGFPFPWKCYDELARVTAAVGWGLCLIAPTATEEQRTRWLSLNPYTVVLPFLPARAVRDYLRQCDATAFTYVTHNTGQSGAILQGIAVGKPVIALSTCRQMRALQMDPLAFGSILWCETFEDVAVRLRCMTIGRFDSGIVALREQESWRHLGKKYAALYHELAASQ